MVGLWTGLACCTPAEAVGFPYGIVTEGLYLNTTNVLVEPLVAPAMAGIEKGAECCSGPPGMGETAVRVPPAEEPACALAKPALIVKWHTKPERSESNGQPSTGGSADVTDSWVTAKG